MNKLIIPVVLIGWPAFAVGAEDKPLLPQRPTINQTTVVFALGGDLWSVGRKGGEARRLTCGPGTETDPVFSPDGKQIAFTGGYDGNRDVYVIPAAGGTPRRLTYHPAADYVVGWTPDGKNVLFRSQRSSYSRFYRLFTVPVEGGFPAEVPLPSAVDGSFSPDGKRMAYVPYANKHFMAESGFHTAWKRYRGGTVSPIWIADLADSSITKVPRKDSNDFNPMWVGERIYFLSDRNGPATLFVYDPATKEVKQLLANKGSDLLSASAGPGAIVYEQLGSLHLFDVGSGESQPLDIRITADFPAIRPQFKKVANQIRNASLSPTGVRVAFEARGEILTVPTEKGDIRNLTNTPGVAERDPAWSPDGRSIACFSDESGEYRLHVRPQDGSGEVKRFDLGDSPSFYYSPIWSTDSKKIAYTDRRLNLWYLDLDKGTSRKVDTNTYDCLTLDPGWSPDSRWLVYTKILKNYLHAVFVHDLATGKSHQLTDGMSDARFPAFDKSGKYLYFTASTDVGPTVHSIEMTGVNLPVTRSVYVLVLAEGVLSPLAPESDEENGRNADRPGGNEATAAKVRIDLDSVGQRILALPIPARNYEGLQAGKAGTLFLVEAADAPRLEDPEQTKALQRFDLRKQTIDKLLDQGTNFSLSADNEKLLYRLGERWFVVPVNQPVKPGDGTLALDAMEVRVDPRAEWRQMYHEAWRIERDFLYDPGAHGLDLKATEKKYASYLDRLAGRQDLNYLFTEMLGELSLGHVFVKGGDLPETRGPRGGLLGADYRLENGRYRFARIYSGESWNPKARAPLIQPGARVREGEYLLAVNGKEVRATENLDRFFEGMAEKSVLLKVGPSADGKGARDVRVVPTADEGTLRYWAWIEGNRRKVDKMTGSRVAYVYLPDTSAGGYVAFNRFFFAQADRDAVIIDERFNSGGEAANHVIDYLRRPLLNYLTTRYGADMNVPGGAIYGPKVMLINEMAGSGGDALPYYFRQAKLGPLVGTRTWGGLVGYFGHPLLLDGGEVTAPHLAFWFPSGKWEVENRGVAPDIEVEFNPKAWREGRDPQLEKAVALVLEELKRNPRPRPQRPAFPNYHKRPDVGAEADKASRSGAN